MTSDTKYSQEKLNELLESIRQEFNKVSQEVNSYRLQNQKDYDFKINQQLAEMQQIRNTVYELELTYRKHKDSYQEEINRLKLEIAQKDKQIATLTNQKDGSAILPAIKNGPATTATTATTTDATSTLTPLISALGSQLPPGTAPIIQPPSATPGSSAPPQQLQQLQQPQQQQQQQQQRCV